MTHFLFLVPDVMARLIPRTLLGSLQKQNLFFSQRTLSTSSRCLSYKPEPWEEIYTTEAIGEIKQK